MKIGFLFYASEQWGMGHIYRNILLMNALKNCYEVVAITNYNKDNFELLESHNLDMRIIKQNDLSSIKSCLLELNLHILIVDKLDNQEIEMRCFKKNANYVISIDDRGEGAQYSDALINAIVPLPKQLPNRVFSGVKYMIFNDAVDKYAQLKKNIENAVTSVMISFGGSDPKNITQFILPCLVEYKNIHFNIVLGPAYKDSQSVLNKYKDVNNFSFYNKLSSLGKMIYESDICIISGGVTLFETLYIGVPSIVICQVEHQVITADKYNSMGCLINLGIVENLDIKHFENVFNRIMSNKLLRKKLNKNAKKIITTNGLCNIVSLIDDMREENDK